MKKNYELRITNYELFFQPEVLQKTFYNKAWNQYPRNHSI
jgi:hypothetical protein